MKNTYAPKLPLPSPLTGDKEDSFARNTILYRLPDNARRVIAENDFPHSVNFEIETLISEIPDRPLRSFREASAPDLPLWQKSLDFNLGRHWLEVPWFFAEMYFYRRILDAMSYFSNGTAQSDPYTHQKKLGLSSTIPDICNLAGRLSEIEFQDFSELAMMLEISLWGNQHDLSLWPVDEQTGKPEAAHRYNSNLLVDQSDMVETYLGNVDNNAIRFDIVVDNAGFELVCDLYCVDYMLQRDVDIRVVIHTKPYPTFVSDATSDDVQATIAALGDIDNKHVQAFSERLATYLNTDRMTLVNDYFWASPYPGWEMSETLRDQLSQSDLVIVKGDMNYRRLLGDLDWAFDTPFKDIVSYFPTPLLALRTLKSEIACGLQAEQITQLQSEDQEWLINGRNGVIQFFDGTDL